MMRAQSSRPKRQKEQKRTGKPLQVYLAPELAAQLEALSQKRHVAKATVVRFAVERLINQLNSGQLELPLGL